MFKKSRHETETVAETVAEVVGQPVHSGLFVGFNPSHGTKLVKLVVEKEITVDEKFIEDNLGGDERGIIIINCKDMPLVKFRYEAISNIIDFPEEEYIAIREFGGWSLNEDDVHIEYCDITEEQLDKIRKLKPSVFETRHYHCI